MEKAGGLVRIKDFKEFSSLINQWEMDEDNRKKAALAALQFIQNQTGSTIKITRDIELILSDLKKE